MEHMTREDVREILKKELRLKVQREPDVDAQSFSVYLELGGEVIPDACVVFSLDFGHHDDDMEFEVV
jgi:hypothetical protein